VSTVVVERPSGPTPAGNISPRRSARPLAFDADGPPADAARGAEPSVDGNDGSGAATMNPLVGEAAQAGPGEKAQHHQRQHRAGGQCARLSPGRRPDTQKRRARWRAERLAKNG